ncbi:hypothetical protein ZIOFF_006060 [Zingiber officinale]|uniref:Uncharacterized protein n=1 Tax=Zingiber officinale TaxID=94328 RepID=A0A8J5I266_ZINOF|nr:hypothetical protein ZIOFF_006060 [Zingiber officinale]
MPARGVRSYPFWGFRRSIVVRYSDACFYLDWLLLEDDVLVFSRSLSFAPIVKSFDLQVSASDKLKIEATMLFKKISLKLDALSHFHFAPKPVIEDMSIQVNVPAVAMEEVAPLVVSDAVMLAPEEIFHGK